MLLRRSFSSVELRVVAGAKPSTVGAKLTFKTMILLGAVYPSIYKTMVLFRSWILYSGLMLAGINGQV